MQVDNRRSGAPADGGEMDEGEFDELYAASYSRLTAQLYAMIGSRDEAEECVQEAFVRAWQHRGKLERTGQTEAWVR